MTETKGAWGTASKVFTGSHSVVRSVYIDGKFARVEWLRTPNGRKKTFRSLRAAQDAAEALNKEGK